MEAVPYILQGLRIDRIQNDSRFRLEVPEFHVGRGEFVAIAGTTGCGKSTLLDVLGLVLRPDRVEKFEFLCPTRGTQNLMRASGRCLSRIRREQLGYVLQSGGLLDFLSVRENIALPARLKGGIRQCRKRVRDLATRLGIDDQLSKSPSRLSGGQRQRASIARALVHDPLVVLADEPTAAVDRLTATHIVGELKRLATERGASVVMVTHDTHLVAPPVCDRVYTFEVQRDPDGTVVSNCYEAVWRTRDK